MASVLPFSDELSSLTTKISLTLIATHQCRDHGLNMWKKITFKNTIMLTLLIIQVTN